MPYRRTRPDDAPERESRRRRYRTLLACGHTVEVVTRNRSAFDVDTNGVELRCPVCGRLEPPVKRGGR